MSTENTKLGHWKEVGGGNSVWVDGPTELDQLRELCREQHKALVEMFSTLRHTEIKGSPGSPLELMREAIAKYEAVVK